MGRLDVLIMRRYAYITSNVKFRGLMKQATNREHYIKYIRENEANIAILNPQIAKLQLTALLKGDT